MISWLLWDLAGSVAPRKAVRDLMSANEVRIFVVYNLLCLPSDCHTIFSYLKSPFWGFVGQVTTPTPVNYQQQVVTYFEVYGFTAGTSVHPVSGHHVLVSTS